MYDLIKWATVFSSFVAPIKEHISASLCRFYPCKQTIFIQFSLELLHLRGSRFIHSGHLEDLSSWFMCLSHMPSLWRVTLCTSLPTLQVFLWWLNHHEIKAYGESGELLHVFTSRNGDAQLHAITSLFMVAKSKSPCSQLMFVFVDDSQFWLCSSSRKKSVFDLPKR